MTYYLRPGFVRKLSLQPVYVQHPSIAAEFVCVLLKYDDEQTMFFFQPATRLVTSVNRKYFLY